MPEYIDLIDVDELERIPLKFRRFLHKEAPPSAGTQSFSFYAFGYTQALQEMVTVALRRWPAGDYMRMPLFYLARHSLELHLKQTIEVFARGAPVDLTGHGLAQLWDTRC
jgi:hypothetical protein